MLTKHLGLQTTVMLKDRVAMQQGGARILATRKSKSVVN